MHLTSKCTFILVYNQTLPTKPNLSPAWKTGIRITLRGTAISVDYLYNFRATECGPGPAEVNGEGVIGPAPPRSLKVTETMYKYLQTHIDVLKLCIIKSVNK